jgi:hypothetical protein
MDKRGDMGSEGYSGMKNVMREIRPGQAMLMIVSWALWAIGLLMTGRALYLQNTIGQDSRLDYVVIALTVWASGGLLGPLFLRRELKPKGKAWIGTLLFGLHIPLYIFTFSEMVKMIVAFGGTGGPPVGW